MQWHKRNLQAILILEGSHLLDSSPVTCHRKQKGALTAVLKQVEALKGRLCAFSGMLEGLEEQGMCKHH